MYELTIVDHFAAAHFIRGYDGPCRDLHGHTWKVAVTLAGETTNDIGLVIDFKKAKAVLERVLEEFDHKNLNTHHAFKRENPTTEHIARYLYQVLKKEYRPLRLLRVAVYESETAYVIYYE